MGWGNATATLRWNHLFYSQLFANFSLIYSRYNYKLGVPEGNPNAFDWLAGMDDVSLKGDFTWFLTDQHTVRYGLQLTNHLFRPGVAQGVGSQTPFNKVEMPEGSALESAVYLSIDHKVNERLTLDYGLRVSMFNNYGPATVFDYNRQYQNLTQRCMQAVTFTTPILQWNRASAELLRSPSIPASRQPTHAMFSMCIWPKTPPAAPRSTFGFLQVRT